jgi:hypothetical protein
LLLLFTFWCCNRGDLEGKGAAMEEQGGSRKGTGRRKCRSGRRGNVRRVICRMVGQRENKPLLFFFVLHFETCIVAIHFETCIVAIHAQWRWREGI